MSGLGWVVVCCWVELGWVLGVKCCLLGVWLGWIWLWYVYLGWVGLWYVVGFNWIGCGMWGRVGFWCAVGLGWVVVCFFVCVKGGGFW